MLAVVVGLEGRGGKATNDTASPLGKNVFQRPLAPLASARCSLNTVRQEAGLDPDSQSKRPKPQNNNS